MTNPVLVTGSNGFIGSRLVQILSERGTALRRCCRQKAQDCDFAIGDINENTDWSAALAKVSVVVHLVGHAHVMKGASENTLDYFRRVNTDASLNLARQAAAAGVRRFIYISSIGVNGARNLQPFNELDSPEPFGPYAVSKWQAEQGLQEISQQTGMEVVIIRPPLVYGPNPPGNFARLIRLLRSGLPLPLGGLHKMRSLVALDNLVDLIALCIDHPAAANQTFLVCDGEDVSTSELLQRMAATLNKPVILLPVPAWLLIALASLLSKQAEARQLESSLRIDASKAHQLLGWTPPISVDEGLRRALLA